MKRRGQQGYTLIEVLVVVFIISIVTSVALLSIGRNDDKQMETFAKELTEIVSLAEEQAMLQPVVLGLALKNNTLHFTHLAQSTADHSNKWVELTDSLLTKKNIPDNVQLSLEMSGVHDDKVKNKPQIIISTNGDVTPFTIYIGKKGKKPRYAVVGEADGSITSRLLT